MRMKPENNTNNRRNEKAETLRRRQIRAIKYGVAR